MAFLRYSQSNTRPSKSFKSSSQNQPLFTGEDWKHFHYHNTPFLLVCVLDRITPFLCVCSRWDQSKIMALYVKSIRWMDH